MNKPKHENDILPLFRILGLVLLSGLITARVPCAPITEAAPGLASKPHLLFILADDLGYGDLGCYGQKKIRTPNLDNLAAEGMRFTQAYSGSTVCAPSRCVLTTGFNTAHSRIKANDNSSLKPEDFTVAELLKKGGYATACVGKWALGDPGTEGVATKQGFDEFFGYLNQTHAHDYYTDYLFRNETRIEIPENKGNARKVYAPDLFTTEALEFIARAAKKPEVPFFLYLAYITPHANNEWGRDTGNGMDVPGDAPYSSESWPQPEKNFAAMITRMDSDIGRILERLKELSLDKNALVIFSSDNGPHHEGGHSEKFFKSSGGLRGCKRDLYEGGIRVPFIANWPGRIAPGKKTDHIIMFNDLLPTAAELAGQPIPEKLDGRSFLPTLLGKPQPAPEAFYWEFHERGFSQAVRMGDWKGVRLRPGAPLELYDLKSDRRERKNVALDQAEIAAKIEQYLHQNEVSR